MYEQANEMKISVKKWMMKNFVFSFAYAKLYIFSSKQKWSFKVNKDTSFIKRTLYDLKFHLR